MAEGTALGQLTAAGRPPAWRFGHMVASQWSLLNEGMDEQRKAVIMCSVLCPVSLLRNVLI